MASEASTSTFTSATFDAFNSQLQVGALKVTRNALALPNDVAFHRSMDSEFARDLDSFSSRVLSLTNKVLALVSTADTTSSRGKGKGKLESQDDVFDNFHSLVVDSMDQLLERTDICLDEFLGRTKPPAIVVNPIAQQSKKAITRGHIDPVIQHASHLQKPQLLFKRKAENSDSPWATHPYRYEITHISYPERMFQPVTPSLPRDFAETPFTWVSTIEDLQSMLAKLRQATEIAVDLEHHSYRSYSGFLCLMQISTRDEDWIVDTLALRNELIELNEVFTDPKIVKVFHGADSDVVWLQQDFNIYIVNLFDTFHASKTLEFPRHGLANLLEMYCDFTPDKRYQLADWRIRPLPREMLEYARSDTHFLLFIYDNLRNALLDCAQSRAQSRAQSLSFNSSPHTPLAGESAHALIRQVLTRSEETSLRTYEKEVYDEQGGSGSNGWDTLARKWNKGALLSGGPGVGVSALQRAVYQAVHKWREMVAREDDESTRYVLPNHFLFQLAEQPPVDMAALLRMFHSVPPVIRKRAKELLEVIRDRIRRHLSDNPAPSAPSLIEQMPAPVPTTTAEASTQPQAMSNDTPMSNLWNRAPASNAAASSSSLLFGSTLPAIRRTSQTTASFSTSQSSLFGSTINSLFPSQLSSNEKPTISPHFHEVVARINSTLVIAPSAPKVLEQGTALVPQDDVIMESSIPEVSGMQVEIPFVPASQRKATQAVEDSIVVVGQAKQKKRKRAKPAPDGAASTSAEGSSQKNKPQNEDAGSRDESEGHEPFDFAAVPNILDDNPNTEDMKQKKRQKKQKSGGVFYGDFPAPPKAHSELKRGNQSHTFK
ncbi:hypothetical protein D9615_008827 [Tricholomella constricta]|uniref:HRDC domain-containing protein n=1 Tax=Tricholomella constricta TaxID=117010 RepID=A0A8H5H038_9AGAR|nr:hypothetical protein D9615_008827 [Tricholomella constricta]